MTATTDRHRALVATGLLDTPPEEAFDRIVELAREACETPIALISFVDADRQWFKARRGFAPAETGLDCSVCIHGLGEPDQLLVVPDLTLDPRTSANPLVTGPDAIRFYAGYPLTLSSGVTVGMLCVIDEQPRPGGVSDEQGAMLRALAATTVANIELSGALSMLQTSEAAERKSVAELSQSENRWRTLFDNLEEGFFIGRLERAEDGSVRDWAYEYVNAAWAVLVGIPIDKAIGFTLRQIIPGVEDAWVMEFADVVETQTPIVFTRRVGTLDQWYQGRCFPIGHDRFAVIFRNVTREVDSAALQDGMIAIMDVIREGHDVSAVGLNVARIVGETLGLARTAFGRVSGDVDFVQLETNWTADGVKDISGRYRFEDFGDIASEMRRGEPLVIRDVNSDPRLGDRAQMMTALGIGAVVNMPVRQRGRISAILMAHSAGPREWSDEDLEFLREVADRLESASARLEAEQHAQLILGETTHRLKNTLALVQAIAKQTLRGAENATMAKDFEERLIALGSAHDVLLATGWRAVDLQSLVCEVLDKLVDRDQFIVVGPSFSVSARIAQSVSLLIHELATNAIKHGAWSQPSGVVTVAWQVEAGDLHMCWVEAGGPPTTPPRQKSFGSRLISRGLAGTGGAHLDYAPSGLIARFEAKLDDLARE